MQAADVVEIRVAEPDPSGVGRIDCGLKRLHEVRAFNRGACFDQVQQCPK